MPMLAELRPREADALEAYLKRRGPPAHASVQAVEAEGRMRKYACDLLEHPMPLNMTHLRDDIHLVQRYDLVEIECARNPQGGGAPR